MAGKPDPPVLALHSMALGVGCATLLLCAGLLHPPGSSGLQQLGLGLVAVSHAIGPAERAAKQLAVLAEAQAKAAKLSEKLTLAVGSKNERLRDVVADASLEKAGGARSTAVSVEVDGVKYFVKAMDKADRVSYSGTKTYCLNLAKEFPHAAALVLNEVTAQVQAAKLVPAVAPPIVDAWAKASQEPAPGGKKVVIRVYVAMPQLEAEGFVSLKQILASTLHGRTAGDAAVPADSAPTLVWTDPSGAAQQVALEDVAKVVGKKIARLHNEKILHGDMHPGNAMVKFEDGKVKVCIIDFGRTQLGDLDLSSPGNAKGHAADDDRIAADVLAEMMETENDPEDQQYADQVRAAWAQGAKAGKAEAAAM